MDGCSRNTERSALPSFFESNHRPSYLYALLDPGDLQHQPVLLDQSAELALVVKHIVVILYFINPSMVPRDGDIGYSYLAFMASSDLDPIGRYVLNDHHVIGLFADALQHDVLTRRFLNGHQLVLHPVLLDESRVLLFADLAVELLEIILDGATNDFLLDF